MKKKSDSYNRYKAEYAKGKFPYFDTEEIEEIVNQLLNERNFSEAYHVIDEGLKLHPNNPQLLKLSDVTTILEKMEAVFQAPNVTSFYDEKIDKIAIHFASEVSQGRYRSALRNLISLARKNELPLLQFCLIVDMHWNEIPTRALARYLIMALSIKSDKAIAYSRLGFMFRDLEYDEYAIIAFEKSLDIDAYNINTWQELALTTFDSSNYEKSMDACDYGLAVDPQNPLLHFLRGIMLADENQYEPALESLEICRNYFESKSDNTSHNMLDDIGFHVSLFYNYIGKCCLMLDKVDKAIEAYGHVLDLVPNDSEALHQLTQCYLDKGDLPNALQTIDKVLKTKRRSIKDLTLKASILSTMGRYDEAFSTIDIMIRNNPKNCNSIMAKAQLALGMGKTDIADESFRKLLSLKPKDEKIKTLMRDYFESINDTDAFREIDNF